MTQTATFLLQKPCGDCTVCCTGPMPVPELDIDYGQPCKHLCEAGCGIYEERIEVCRVFSCAWKTNFVPDSQRPDKSGVICKWTEGGAMLLVPVSDKAPSPAVQYWKSFAKKMNQNLGLYERETGTTKSLVEKR